MKNYVLQCVKSHMSPDRKKSGKDGLYGSAESVKAQFHLAKLILIQSEMHTFPNKQKNVGESPIYNCIKLPKLSLGSL